MRDLLLWWRAALIAARFLTRAPLPDPARGRELHAADYGRAALLYPLVGLLLGGLLGGLAGGLNAWLGATAAPLIATLVLGVWSWGTGALHLDGLADCADAWVGGLGDRARTQEILKDPHLGVMGAVALLLASLTKWSALWVLVAAPGTAMLALLLIPALARLQILLLALTTPSANTTGMGAALRNALPRGPAWAVAILSWLLAWLWLGWGVLGWGLVAGGTLWLWRRSLQQRLGGFSGDTAGALVEMTEVVLLILAAARIAS